MREHYTKFGDMQPIHIIDHYSMGFKDGNALKYLLRYKHKGQAMQDLEKAKHYIELLLEEERLKELG